MGNVVLHKILLNNTNIHESAKHLSDEITDYSADVFQKAQLYSWSEEEKSEIKNKILRRVKSLIVRYPDVKYDEKEAIMFAEEIIDEML